MVLKFYTDPGEVYLIEPTGLKKWADIKYNIGKDKEYKQVLYRHVYF